MEKKTTNTPPILPSSSSSPSPGPGPRQFTSPPSQGPQFRTPPVQFTTPPGPGPHQFTPPGPGPQQFTTPPGPGPHQFTPPPGPGPQQFTTPPGPGPQQFTAPPGPGLQQFITPPGPGPQQFTPVPGPQQFSTPPGPPVFSSPLRAPLRPSPYGPGAQTQSSSFYSGGFSNGSQELPVSQPVSARDFDLGFESPFVRFSAHKVLKRKKQANIPSLGFGAIVSPGQETQPGPEPIERDPHRCRNCGAFSNLYCEIQTQTGQWNCAICNYQNSSEGHYICNSQQDLFLYPELATSAVDYVLHSNNRRPGFVSAGDMARSSGPIFVLIDECLDEPHLQHLQGSLHAFVDSLNPTQRVGFITFGRTVSIYDFSEGSVVSADTVPGEKLPSQDTLKPLIYGTGLYLSHMHASLPVAHSIISSLRPYRLPVQESLRDRCLATAVETALCLIRGPTAEINRGIIRKSGGSCRILACLGGPCTFGPGSVPGLTSHPNYAYLERNCVKYMEKLGLEARKCGTVVDLLCAGTCPVRVSVLQPLVRESGGVLILHDDFGETFGVNLQRASTRSSGSNGLFEIRCSDELLVTQVIGPGEESESQPDPHENFKNDNSISVQMNSVEETQSFTISFEHKKDIKREFVYFQFSVRFSTPYQSEISRVITLRVPTTDSLSSYLSSIQSDTSAVIISKLVTLDAKTPKDCETLKKHSIDERIKDISHKLGSYKFPKEIADIPELLFHLRRGPLLGGIITHEDERSVLREVFLNGDFEICLRMVGPRCLMYREGGEFEECKAYDLVMQSDKAVVLDHGTDIFIWLGAELAGQESKSAAALAACRTIAEELSETRFPAPRILSFKEGSSQARYFVSRLIPAHKDPTYEQEARFPQLQTLTQDQRSRLKSSFVHFDDFSFCEWMRNLKLVPPEPS